ncbi:MAG: tRNA lysidine(34) synthetase TilS [Phycisphaerales bacterium]|nr:MAG: tRNA lysidine(34) synthetase TilS [Phycisphaerales bacterium]
MLDHLPGGGAFGLPTRDLAADGNGDEQSDGHHAADDHHGGGDIESRRLIGLIRRCGQQQQRRHRGLHVNCAYYRLVSHSASKPSERPDKSAPLPIQARRHPLVPVVRGCLLRETEYTGGPIVIAASGGVDSTALLATMLALREQAASFLSSVEPVLAHVHHHLRQEADHDAEHVRQLAERFGVLHERADIYPDHSSSGNLAEAAREMRYNALVEIAQRHEAKIILTAHHAEDQLETILMNLARGAGVEGLSGMRPVRTLKSGVKLVRPLLSEEKESCRSLCLAAGLTWREDASNRDRDRSRNRLRADVLPILESLWPHAARRAHTSAEQLAWAATLVERELDRVFGSRLSIPDEGWPRSTLRAHPIPLLTAGLRRVALQNEPALIDRLGYVMVRKISEAIHDADDRPRRFSLGPHLTVEVTSKHVNIKPISPQA